MPIAWPSLHPVQLFQKMNKIWPTFPFTVFGDFMKRAGITSGYQEKPCLNQSWRNRNMWLLLAKDTAYMYVYLYNAKIFIN